MKKFLSLLLAFTMLFSIAVPAFAGGEPDTGSVTGSDIIVKIIDKLVEGLAGFFEKFFKFFEDFFKKDEAVGYYTIKYVDADGTLYGQASYAAGATITPPAIPHKEGYVFMNWYPAIPDEMPEKDIVVTAQWAEKIDWTN